MFVCKDAGCVFTYLIIIIFFNQISSVYLDWNCIIKFNIVYKIKEDAYGFVIFFNKAVQI